MTNRELQDENERLRQRLGEAYDSISDALELEDADEDDDDNPVDDDSEE